MLPFEFHIDNIKLSFINEETFLMFVLTHSMHLHDFKWVLLFSGPVVFIGKIFEANAQNQNDNAASNVSADFREDQLA
jgi:hypothetical protein